MMSQSSSEISLQEVTLNPIGDMEQRPPIVPKLAWVEEEEEGPGAAPEEQPAEVEQFQLPQEDAALDRTQEQDGAHGRSRRAAQEETSIMGTGSMENCDVYSTDTSAAMLDLLVQRSVSVAKQVPAMVRDIHQWLMANESDEQSLDRTLLELAEAHPADVGITLLRVAPSCDRAATTMWKTIMSSPMTAEPALLLLLDVLGSWPEHSTRTSDGDNTDVFALAATVVMWKILQVSCCPRVVTPRVFFPRLFVHLLSQVFFSTVEMTEKVDNLWRLCREEHDLPTEPSRFAVQTLKVLLCRLEYEHVVVAVQCKRGWDALLCADTHPYAVALLAREMHCASIPFCSRIARHLLELLSRVEPKWDLPALVFFVEVLKCLDLRECGDSVVEVSSKYLQSERRQMRRLALRALLVLRDDPSVAERTWSLTESLVKLLRENASDVVGMSIIVLSSLLTYNGAPIPHPIALQLAEALLPLFENDDSQVQLLSMSVFRTLMSLVAEEGEKPLKTQVCRSLVPLFFHCHDENRNVAEASQGTLLCVAKFLKRKDFEKPLKKQQLWKFAECLVRTVWKSKLQSGEAPCSSCSVCGAGSCAPAHCCTQGCQPAPHTLLPSRSRTGSSPGSSGPEPGAHGARAPLGRGAGRHRGSPGSSRPSAPSRARRQRLLAGPRGRAGRGGQGWAQGAPGQGAEPAPTLPSWRSLQLAEDRSRVARHLYQAINYVDSPQESLREAAVGFIEIAARRLRRQSSDFRFIWLALEHMRRDVSPAIRSLALQTLFALGIADTGPYPLVQRLQDQLRRAWETRPRLPGLGCLRFWSSVWR
ncbi:maestro heat-like repeat-containing protein family member 7 isoform X2 [Corvus kubaryi]|uniref:maestro heat-like repeat-containing protein family member 7 isoform X2 n=1 Tax=Corvus kubaryi TaxID=68294 RepID=UPI001C05CB1E|nr:maestro heat-like repeat-containing protein family member 7 isoform X2 [Corvus kubaryi]